MLETHAQEPAAVSSKVETWLAQALARSPAASRTSRRDRLIEDLGLDSLAMAELAERIAAHADAS